MSAILVTRDVDVEVWSLNRPRLRNALDPDLVDELHGSLLRAEAAGVRVVILAGNGPSFCTGADLSYLLGCARTGCSPRPFLECICNLTLAIEASPVVFVAALHGHVVAGGLELALSCDLVIAASGTLIGDGHVRNNLVPGGGASVRLAPKLGSGPAAWLALSGELVPVESLVSTGWLHAVVPPESLMDSARSIAGVLTSRSAEGQRRFKALLRPHPNATRTALWRELDEFDAHWRSQDVARDLSRFLTGPRSLTVVV